MDADDERVARLYTDFLAAHGPTHRALNWSSAESQRLRFKRLSALGLSSNDTVLDVGCGLGDFLPWLDAHTQDVAYTGLDMTPAMIAHCQATHPRGRFVLGSLLDTPPPFPERSFDWVVASGVFAHRKVAPWAYMTALISRMLPLATRGIAFNSQSTRAADPASWTLFHADPEATLAYCRRLEWPCTMTHTPDNSDFTVYLWRPEATDRG